MSRPPIEDGAVVVIRDRVQWVGRWRDLPPGGPDPFIDLGEGLLMPGLINAHAHLDYTGMAGLIPPRRSFADWIKSINALKGSTSLAEFEKAWKLGADMLVATGTTTVANISAIPELIPEILSSTPLRIISFLEVIGVKPDREPALFLSSASSRLERCLAQGYPAGLSPHSLYATTPALMRLCFQTAAQKNWLLTIHLAESAEEYDMFRSARGPLHDWLRTQRDMSDCGWNTPTAALDRLGLTMSRLLAVHANYLDPGDIDLLARWGAGVAHCPHSHAYFQHRPFPLEELAAAGITICLGTDSLASREASGGLSPVLDMRSEMQVLASAHPHLTAEQILRMATLEGARALGWVGQIGEITPGALADLVVWPSTATSRHWYDEVIHSHGPVLASMREGRWIMAPLHQTAPSHSDAT